jgi:triosephosphate isomerase (TIM)
MRRKIVAGNWKMNTERASALALCEEICDSKVSSDVELVVFPPFVFIDPISARAGEKLKVGAQNFYFEEKGAFTGEISIAQLKSVGASIVLIGHSERRELFQESNAFLKKKVDAALKAELDFIFCCGEPLNIRKSGREFDFVKTQLEESLFHLSAEQMNNVIIAYEPIWAIGTGETASAIQAEEMHAAIRDWIREKYTETIAANVVILYGGSCKPDNANELFACKNVDGGLIGGASLNAADFSAIANAF